jgi:hypothetical protein
MLPSVNMTGVISVVRGGAVLGGWRLSPAHGFLALQVDAVRAVHEAIQDRIRERGIADVLVPMLDR